MATDPICGMSVNPTTAAGKHEYNGHTYYFCSPHCAQKFKEDPEKWLHAQPAGHKHGTASRSEHARSETHAAQPSNKVKPGEGGAEYWIRRSASPGRALAPSAAWRWSRRPVPSL
jgi:YHS domain-containing protein